MPVLPFPFYSFYYFILYCTAGIPPFYSLFRFSITYRALVYYSNTPLLTVYKTTKVCYVGRTTLTEVLSSGLSSSDFVYASSTLSCAVTADSPSQYRHIFLTYKNFVTTKLDLEKQKALPARPRRLEPSGLITRISARLRLATPKFRHLLASLYLSKNLLHFFL